jgi:hypothetical protein
VIIVGIEMATVEQDLLGGRLSCSGCGRRFRPSATASNASCVGSTGANAAVFAAGTAVNRA